MEADMDDSGNDGKNATELTKPEMKNIQVCRLANADANPWIEFCVNCQLAAQGRI